ncbi:NmrA family NAD(P)-binding protein [Gilvibacter sp.]|uniref:NmrA family NAD(P)-binding protein n=1 Tax=Gilvibacter sp. TaxID=2729997 RepID=UPI003B52BEE3
MKNQFLILGGTGKTGSRIAKLLQERGELVRLGSRSANPAFNWEDTSNWAHVLHGITHLYITYQPDLAVPGAFEAVSELVAQAKVAGVQKIVLLSGKGETEAQRCEHLIKDSGIDYTIIQCNWFSQNWSESFLMEPVLAGHVALPMSTYKIPFVDADDIADVAVEVFLNPAHNGLTYELTGPKGYTFREAVATIAEASGRSIGFTPVSIADYKAVMQQMGLGDDYVWLITYLFTEVIGNPDNSIITNDIEKIIGRPAKDFQQYANEMASSGVWRLSEKAV